MGPCPFGRWQCVWLVLYDYLLHEPSVKFQPQWNLHKHIYGSNEYMKYNWEFRYQDIRHFILASKNKLNVIGPWKCQLTSPNIVNIGLGDAWCLMAQRHYQTDVDLSLFRSLSIYLAIFSVNNNDTICKISFHITHLKFKLHVPIDQ